MELRGRTRALMERRQSIVAGLSEPGDADIAASTLLTDVPTAAEAEAGAAAASGVPGFWVAAMRECDSLETEDGPLCTERDWRVLEHLSEIRMADWEPPAEEGDDAFDADEPADGLGFSLHFTFEPNPFLEPGCTELALFCHHDGEVARVAEPVWQSGADPTTVGKKKKIKRKGGPSEVVAVQRPTHSFFRLFALPDFDEEGDENGPPTAAELQSHLVLLLAEDLIPNATGYYLRSFADVASFGDEMDGDLAEADEDWTDGPPPPAGRRRNGR